MKYLLFIGMMLIFIGILLIFISSFTAEKQNIKTAGGIFLGPIPIFGFASNKKMLYLLFALAITIFIIFTLLRKWT